MRNDEHHDDEHELQPEEEQESQLNGPDDDTPSQGTRKRFSLTSTRDGIRRFNAWCDKSPIVSLVSKIVLGVGAILIALFTGIQICEHWVPDYEVVTPGETALPRFSDDIVGILLPRFSGADLREYFGEDGLNRALAIRVAMQLRKEELDSLVEVETISRVIDSEDEAQRVKDSCNAAAIIWGNATKVGGLVDISMIFDAGALAFEAIVPGLEPMEVTF
ncbi:MAG: hypothetical protein KAT58_10900, partial [candidate division Zixibacteria bacterium]|nr:hypothetical protein [candidate division Zixibacteria bacterium]